MTMDDGDLKTRLERLANRSEQPRTTEGFSRLHSARDRRARRRRVGTVAVALLVAIGGSSLAFSALRDGGTSTIGDQPVAWQPPDVLTVWPENPVRGETPQDVQAAVDAGEADLQWRLDPKEVAFRFGRTFLAWKDVTVTERDVETEDGTRAFDITPCPPSAVCDMEGPMPTLWLAQPVRSGDGGIWSVVAVMSDRLAVELQPTDPQVPLAGGTTLRFQLDLPDWVSAHLGIVARNGCTDAFEFNPGLDSGPASLKVPEAVAGTEADLSCGTIGAGYVFAYAQDDTTVPTGDPLVEPAAIEFPYATILPVYLQMIEGDATTASAAAVPDVAAIMCDGTSTTVQTPTVAAQADGVHIAIHNTAGERLSVQFESSGTSVEADSVTALVQSLAPGTQQVRCQRPSEDAGASGGWATLEVVDPAGHFTDPTLDCEKTAEVMYNSGPIDFTGDPADEMLEAARTGLTGAVDEPGEVVPAGYPQSADLRSFLFVTDDDRSLAVYELSWRSPGWYPDGYRYCSG
jgi:hypothetical protein